MNQFSRNHIDEAAEEIYEESEGEFNARLAKKEFGKRKGNLSNFLLRDPTVSDEDGTLRISFTDDTVVANQRKDNVWDVSFQNGAEDVFPETLTITVTPPTNSTEISVPFKDAVLPGLADAIASRGANKFHDEDDMMFIFYPSNYHY